MKQLFKKIGAILMAFVVLLSTMSFTISEHYCGDHLVASSFFSKAESCGMKMENPSPNKDCGIQKDNCCKDVIKQIKGQNDLKIDFQTLNFEQQQFITSFVYTYSNLFEGFKTNSIPFKYYSPPQVDKDINVLYRVFRI